MGVSESIFISRAVSNICISCDRRDFQNCSYDVLLVLTHKYSLKTSFHFLSFHPIPPSPQLRDASKPPCFPTQPAQLWVIKLECNKLQGINLNNLIQYAARFIRKYPIYFTAHFLYKTTLLRLNATALFSVNFTAIKLCRYYSLIDCNFSTFKIFGKELRPKT